MIVGAITFIVWAAHGFPTVHYGSDYYSWFAVSSLFAGFELGKLIGKANAKSG